jgi:hypothetical protein
MECRIVGVREDGRNCKRMERVYNDGGIVGVRRKGRTMTECWRADELS